MRISYWSSDVCSSDLFLFAALLVMPSSGIYAQQQVEPWNYKQLVATETLAARIDKGDTKNLLILSIGPDAVIKGSVDIGPTSEKENISKLRNLLKDVPKDKEVVIYCGCCPFVRCPNIRPAFLVLNAMGYKNGKLLDVHQNIKVDWLDKDYATND